MSKVTIESDKQGGRIFVANELVRDHALMVVITSHGITTIEVYSDVKSDHQRSILCTLSAGDRARLAEFLQEQNK